MCGGGARTKLTTHRLHNNVGIVAPTIMPGDFASSWWLRRSRDRGCAGLRCRGKATSTSSWVAGLRWVSPLRSRNSHLPPPGPGQGQVTEHRLISRSRDRPCQGHACDPSQHGTGQKTLVGVHAHSQPGNRPGCFEQSPLRRRERKRSIRLTRSTLWVAERCRVRQRFPGDPCRRGVHCGPDTERAGAESVRA